MSNPDRAARRRAERAGIVVPGNEDPNLTLDQRALRDRLGIPSEAQTDDTPRPIQIGKTATPGGDDLDLTNAGKPAAGGMYSQEDFEELRQAALVLMRQMDEERRDTLVVTAGLVMAAGGEIRVPDALQESVGSLTQLRRSRDEATTSTVWEIVTPVADCEPCSGVGSQDGEHPCPNCEGQGILYERWTP